MDKKVPDPDLLLQEEMKKIDWNKVDAYPSVDACDSLFNESERKQCFFDFISSQLQARLDLDTLTSVYPQADTLEVLVTVFPDAHIEFALQTTTDSLQLQSQQLDSILRLRLDGFPEINPALKRGVPIKTQFVLPVILKMD